MLRLAAQNRATRKKGDELQTRLSQMQEAIQMTQAARGAGRRTHQR